MTSDMQSKYYVTELHPYALFLVLKGGFLALKTETVTHYQDEID